MAMPWVLSISSIICRGAVWWKKIRDVFLPSESAWTNLRTAWTRCAGAVLAPLLERCSNRAWRLLAAHVRTSHVHVVAEAEARPERVMNNLRSHASRYLNQQGLDELARRRWARHGSTRWLWKPEDVSAAIR